MEANSKLVMFAVNENHLVAFLIFVVSFVGLLANATVALFSSTLGSLQNSFGRLSASQAIGEGILTGLFCFFYVPTVFFSLTSWQEVSTYCGVVLLFCYDVCIYCHLFISLNRLTAICFPIRYDQIFSIRTTTVYIVIAYVLAASSSFYVHYLNHCEFAMTGLGWIFMFETNPICGDLSLKFNGFKDILVVSIIAVVDVITLLAIHLTRKAILQGVVFVTELFSYFVLPNYFENRWLLFFSTTFAWNIVHSADPLIIILLNKEFRKLISKPFSKLSCSCISFKPNFGRITSYSGETQPRATNTPA
ncbi:unnamed protein product [Caenorhabditis auriculariae]|uniref:7TM GPCR serpentine receptor class x (Srx) domain-containing protein n=1 Tax=Caenorhabditis auriculariae TaxID=2777116 RepID=A0A8S1HAR9_9PELO|nr:unnamed protein product [Caenorhabditis auriculariae]